VGRKSVVTGGCLPPDLARSLAIEAAAIEAIEDTTNGTVRLVDGALFRHIICGAESCGETQTSRGLTRRYWER
jgi:hypothetical protein